MIGKCNSCLKKVQGTKKPISWFWLIILGFIPYGIYRIIFIRRNRCPMCGLRL